MIGWFEAAETGECDCCGRRTGRGERVYYGSVSAWDVETVDMRLCVECAP